VNRRTERALKDDTEWDGELGETRSIQRLNRESTESSATWADKRFSARSIQRLNRESTEST